MGLFNWFYFYHMDYHPHDIGLDLYQTPYLDYLPYM